MAETLTDLLARVQIFDPATGQPTRDFLQKFNALVKLVNAHTTELDDHEARITDLEP